MQFHNLLLLLLLFTSYTFAAFASTTISTPQTTPNTVSIQKDKHIQDPTSKQPVLKNTSSVINSTNKIISFDSQFQKAYEQIQRINQAVNAQRARKNIKNRAANQINNNLNVSKSKQIQLQSKQTEDNKNVSMVNGNKTTTINSSKDSQRQSVNNSKNIQQQAPSTDLSMYILSESPDIPKSVLCDGVYVSGLNACLPPECPINYTWNSALQKCEPPVALCRSNMTWNGTACIPNILISNPKRITTEYILETNGITCPKGVTKCIKPVCPKGFVWLENCCVPIKTGEVCPLVNMYGGFCMPNYIAEITIKDKCLDSKYGGLGCGQISDAYKYNGKNLPNTTALKPSINSGGSEAPVVTPQSSLIIKKQQQYSLDLTIPGIVSPIVPTYLPPSYIQDVVPKFIF